MCFDDLLLPETDNVKHPAHYNQSSLECWDAIKASMSDEAFRGFLRGNIFKCIWRCEDKGGAQDVRKAAQYCERLVEELEATE